MGVEEEIEFEVSLEGQVGQGMEHISDGRVSIYGFIHVWTRSWVVASGKYNIAEEMLQWGDVVPNSIG